MLRTDLVPGALLYLSCNKLPIEGYGYVLSKRPCGYNIYLNKRIMVIHVASTPTKVLISAKVNPLLPNMYYTFSAELVAPSPNA